MNARAREGLGPGFVEFVFLMALIISLIALSIDAMLPALPAILADLDVARVNDGQYVISMLFAGMGLGQILFGPLSDAVGRRASMLLGFVIFAVGCVFALTATSFGTMLFGRFLQGLGASGPRIITIALVRDIYKGREMARVMSFIMTIFILVPVVAPALGQLIIAFASWRYIFAMFLLIVVIVAPWFYLRQPETLPAERRNPMSPARLLLDTAAILRIRATLGYTLTMGCIFGAFIAYLSTSQQIFQVQYGLGTLFPLYFGILACAIGGASLVNARLVMRFGMRRLSRIALITICGLSLAAWAIAKLYAGQPPLALLMTYLLPLFFCFGILFGNLNALAMEPLGHVAGLGSAVVGTISTLLSVVFGVVAADAYDRTVVPLIAGFALLGLAGLMLALWTERGAPAET